jgi:general stress protein YciG
MKETIKTLQTNQNSSKGFASMDKEKQREIAKKGGKTVSQNREHMREIGAKGGKKSGEVRLRNKYAPKIELDSLNQLQHLNNTTNETNNR